MDLIITLYRVIYLYTPPSVQGPNRKSFEQPGYTTIEHIHLSLSLRNLRPVL